MKKTLTLFSYLFHPIFIPLFGALFYFFYNENYFEDIQKYLILFQIIIITILIPVSFFYLLKTLGKVDSIMVKDLSQRKIPLIIQSALLLILITKGITFSRIPELFYFLIGGLWSTLITLALLFGKIKASLHMLGISSLTAFVIGLSIHNQVNITYIISFLIVMNGLLAASRIVMNAHSNNELVIGFFVGMLPQIILWCFWL